MRSGRVSCVCVQMLISVLSIIDTHARQARADTNQPPDTRCVNRCALSRSHDPVGARAREPYPDTPYGFKAVAYGMARTAPGVAVGVGPS